MDRAAEPDLFGAVRAGAARDVLLVGALRAELLDGAEALDRDALGALEAEDLLGALEGALVACDL